MEFNITTKYDLEDKVYVAEFYEGYIPSRELTVATIEFSVSANKTKVVYYLNEGDDYKGYYSEEALFSTCEDCTKWCEKHNKIL